MLLALCTFELSVHFWDTFLFSVGKVGRGLSNYYIAFKIQSKNAVCLASRKAAEEEIDNVVSHMFVHDKM